MRRRPPRAQAPRAKAAAAAPAWPPSRGRPAMIALFLALCASAAADPWFYEDNVVVLDPDNFDVFIAEQEYTIVEFCGWLRG